MRKLTSKAAIRFLIAFGLSGSTQLMALPFKVDLGLTSKASQVVNGKVLVSDMKTGKLIASRSIRNPSSVTLDFPHEGLYTLDLKDPSGVTLWKETVYVILEIPSRDLLMRGSWAVAPGTMRTVLRVQDPKGELQYGVSIRDRIFLRLRVAPRLVRVFQEDYSGLSTPARGVSLGPVSETSARAESAAGPSPELRFELGDGDDQLAFEPDYKGLLAGKEDNTLREKIQALGGAKRLEPLNRPHRLYGWVRLMQEGFTVRRDPDTYNGEKTQGFGTGFGGDFIVKETMTLQAEIDTHGTKTEYEAGGTSQAPAAEQRRIHARVGALFDVLNANHGYPRWAFELGPVLGFTQVPLEKDNEGVTEFGLSVRGQYFGQSFHTEGQFRLMKSHSRDLSLLWLGRGFQIFTVSPLFGLYYYLSEFDAADAKAEFSEVGVRFGIHREF